MVEKSLRSTLYCNRLRRRFLGLVGVSLVVPVLLVNSGCQNSVLYDSDPGPPGTGGNGQGGAGTVTTATTMNPTTTATSAGPGGWGDPGSTVACAKVPGAVTVADCPAADDWKAVNSLLADQLFGCGFELEGPAEFHVETGTCCYPIYEYTCGAGRPYREGGEARHANAEDSTSWMGEQQALVRVDDLSSEERDILRDAWLQDALLEHASIASFGRFALELMAHGAPADLLASAHAAAMDEVHHAADCFRLASAYAGRPLGPSNFDFAEPIAVEKDLAAVARATFEEGCINETWASIAASEQFEEAQDLAVKAVLAKIRDDEARHAELAWRSLHWMLQVGGVPVRQALDASVKALERRLDEPQKAGHQEKASFSNVLLAHGRISKQAQHDCFRQAMREAVLPCARAMLALRAARPSEPHQQSRT